MNFMNDIYSALTNKKTKTSETYQPGLSRFFQHYFLYAYCFNKEHCHVTKSETVHIETALVLPLSESLITEEYEAALAAKAAAKAAAEAEEKARQDAAAQAAAEAAAAAEALRLAEERKRKPETLEEAVEFVVREKMEVAKQQLAEEYSQREQALVQKFQELSPAAAPKAEPPKKKK
ncbi:uncharacterized protein LOC112346244 [Selaginella moellendorffii]|uniref:uncharacterized protein LOC112346244 n=1 Tax=Selaginella moellendorffii TaxID=88036 RepID=UPI000D1C7A08|nr:uncharacterized protein LOC112346244 [Selaginella moellendorffii]XP_024530454.1 uncharacterized protein LOC112346244 [Selaginella moellendorffii]XP_024530455.1 uncharacterized protein LOC112346244 [Selaginella moellendorffii]|eukprot:XP_024530453.1 uncharacterized protein LOC112346244 [Selaginella moellendorffii]